MLEKEFTRRVARPLRLMVRFQEATTFNEPLKGYLSLASWG